MKTTKQGGQQKGFTIIEVVLVLAVAGLIFLVVFAAIPRLQASRRDNQRKRDLEALAGLIIEYQSNTGDYPNRDGTTGVARAFLDYNAGNTTSAAPFFDYIVDANLDDPSSGQYVFNDGSTSTWTVPGTFRYLPGSIAGQPLHSTWSVCATTNDAFQNVGNGGDYAIVMLLERGYYCVDNR